MRSYCHNAVCVLLLVCSKSQPDDDGDGDDNPIGSKHVGVWKIHKVVFDDCLFAPYFAGYVNLEVTKWGQV